MSNDLLDKELTHAIGEIVVGLYAFEKEAKKCPDRSSTNICGQGDKMPNSVRETFSCSPCLWAWCPRVNADDRAAFRKSLAHE